MTLRVFPVKHSIDGKWAFNLAACGFTLLSIRRQFGRGWIDNIRKRMGLGTIVSFCDALVFRIIIPFRIPLARRERVPQRNYEEVPDRDNLCRRGGPVVSIYHIQRKGIIALAREMTIIDGRFSTGKTIGVRVARGIPRNDPMVLQWAITRRPSSV